MFWWYILPVGFLLTMYTQTGYDASAHVAEETREAEISVARGLWQSVFYAALFGWLVLLAITFAASDTSAINEGGGTSISIFTSAMSEGWAEAVILISLIGQVFCGMAGLTSASRTFFAFSRDRAVPGWRLWSRVETHRRVPVYAVLGMTGLCLLVTIPAFWGNAAGVPWAFYAIVSITVIGLYIAYVMPVYLRLRAGDDFEPGAWNLGGKYRWMCAIAVGWTAVAVVIFSLPFTPAGVPWRDEFDWTAMNYSPITVIVVMGAVGIWWLVSARRTFQGPVRQVEFDEAMGIVEEKPEPTGATPG
jgi:amino acid transporter